MVRETDSDEESSDIRITIRSARKISGFLIYRKIAKTARSMKKNGIVETLKISEIRETSAMEIPQRRMPIN
jgi:hypothetical protein